LTADVVAAKVIIHDIDEVVRADAIISRI